MQAVRLIWKLSLVAACVGHLSEDNDHPRHVHRHRVGSAKSTVSRSQPGQQKRLLRRGTMESTEDEYLAGMLIEKAGEESQANSHAEAESQVNMTAMKKNVAAMAGDEDAVEQLRVMLGMSPEPCSKMVADAETQNLTDKEAVRECQQHDLTSDACGYALQLLGSRPWPAEQVAIACEALGEPAPPTRPAGSTPGSAVVSLLLERVSQDSKTSSRHSSLDRTTVPKARLVKPRAECLSSHTELGVKSSLGACAEAVKEWGGRYFSFGKNERKGECKWESSMTIDCPEGFKPEDNFDFYAMDDRQQAGSCQRPATWCKGEGAVYDLVDCDRDGIADPFCVGPGPGVSGFLSSKTHCEDTFPTGGCNARQLKSMDSDQCMTQKGGVATVEDCAGVAPNQQWYFAGQWLLVTSSKKCLGVEHDIVGMYSCSASESMKWHVDAVHRLKQGENCITRDPLTNALSVELCKGASTQRYYFTPVRDCKWSEWGAWATCSASCDSGTKARYRFVAEAAEKGGLDCAGEAQESSTCAVPLNCPVHCKWGSWQEWEACSKTCARGLRERHRVVLDWPMYGGTTCPGLRSQKLTCNAIPCPDDCQWGSWGQYEACSAHCGGGERKRQREIVLYAKAGGRPCGCCAEETLTCNHQPCPEECRWSAWSLWSTPAHTCGAGAQQRSRLIVQQASGGGAACIGAAVDERPNVALPCPLDCTWEAWDDWASCPVSCGVGRGRAWRARGSRTAINGGAPCAGTTDEFRFCNNVECPIDCTWGMWDEWSPCWKGYRNGEYDCFKRRLRETKAGVEFGGKGCKGVDFETAKCPHCHSKMKEKFWKEYKENGGKGIGGGQESAGADQSDSGGGGIFSGLR